MGGEQMNLALLVVLLLFIGAVLFLAIPFFKPASVNLESKEGEEEGLLLKKQEVFESLRDLEMDYQTKKVDQKDYQRIYQETVAEGAQVLEKMDELNESGIKKD